MPKINVKGTQYYYEIHGKGDPFVLISGFGGDHSSWLPIIKILSLRFQVIIFDNRGAGQTIDKGEDLTAESMADDVVELIQLLGLKKPHIMGQSMGGAIAQSIASRYGDQIDKLILLMTTAKWRSAVLLALDAQIKMMENKISFEEIFLMLISWTYGEDFLSDKKKVEELKKDVLAKKHPQSIQDKKRQLNVLKKFNGIEDLRKIFSKTLVVFGAEDVAVLPKCAQKMASFIRDVRVVECSCGHGIIKENPKKLTEIIFDFLV